MDWQNNATVATVTSLGQVKGAMEELTESSLLFAIIAFIPIARTGYLPRIFENLL
jgi:hypothetical protein